MTTINKRPATPRQTFALFCATGKDWRASNLSFEVASAMIAATMAHKNNKPVAFKIATAIAGGLCVDTPTAPTAPSFEAIYDEAHKAGMKAGETCSIHLPCGFAWVNFKGNTGFGKWMKAKGIADKSYGSGLNMWIHHFNQSMNKKESYGYAFVEVLKKHGIEASIDSHID
jgi:hypothetical protein